METAASSEGTRGGVVRVEAAVAKAEAAAAAAKRGVEVLWTRRSTPSPG